jgi:hypothetical protein
MILQTRMYQEPLYRNTASKGNYLICLYIDNLL